jgi:hypothetical protein
MWEEYAKKNYRLEDALKRLENGPWPLREMWLGERKKKMEHEEESRSASQNASEGSQKHAAKHQQGKLSIPI